MKIAFFSLLLSFSFLISCHQELIPFQGAVKYGYMTKKGDTVIPIKYLEAKPFREGYARVGVHVLIKYSLWHEPLFGGEGYWEHDQYQDIRYTFIDEEDNLMDIRLNDAKSFNKGLAAAKLKGKWGYINTRGEWVIAPQYAEAESFKKGKAEVTREDTEANRWYAITIDPNNKVIVDDPTGKRKPDRFDSIPDWRVLVASGGIYVRLTDYSTAFDYFLGAARRIDVIAKEDTLAYMDLCTNLAKLAAMRVNEPIYEKYDLLARDKFEEIVASNIERRRIIILNYIQYLIELSEVRENNLQKDLEKETLERIIDAVKRSKTEDLKLYWDIEERLEAFED